MATTYSYEKLVDGNLKTVNNYTIDHDKSITGKFIVNVKAYFDENPEERIRLGWTKHIHPDRSVVYDKQTHYLVTLPKQIDEYTIEDQYYALPKSEEMLELEEMLESLGVWYDAYEDNDYGVVGDGGIRFF